MKKGIYGTIRSPREEKQLLFLSRSQGTGQPSDNNNTGPAKGEQKRAPGERGVYGSHTNKQDFLLWEVRPLLVLRCCVTSFTDGQSQRH